MPTRKDQNAYCRGGSIGGASELVHKSVADVESFGELLEGCLPTFGGAYVRRLWMLLDECVGRGLPMTLSVSGPVTASGQHFAWLNPLLDTGWFAYVSTTDAVCYHDGHRALDDAKKHPFHSVAIFGDDAALRDERTIRITDIGFDEDVLLGQDQFVTAVLREEEFQHKMTGTELRWRLGRRYAAQEQHNGAREGLLALCQRKSIPIFVGAPADGSVFLNAMKLWAMAKLTGQPFLFELDLCAEVFESCAYHYWGLRESPTKALGTLILGGGVPKNFNLQPEPALSQVLGIPNISGYLYDVQITTAPVTDGSLSSCPPAEAVTWGKVDKDHFRSTCESVPADYSMVMPFVAKALIEKRARFALWADRMGPLALFAKHPEARGYLRATAGYRLFDRRDELVAKLLASVKKELPRLEKESRYPLAKAATVKAAARAPRARSKAARAPRARSKAALAANKARVTTPDPVARHTHSARKTTHAQKPKHTRPVSKR